MDDTVRKRVWDGVIPLIIELASNEITTLEAPAPLICHVPRCSYLSLLDPLIRHFFVGYTPPISTHDSQGLWFECDSKPLKWNLPAGLLYDLLSETHSLPWKITVHFQAFPVDEILPCPDENTAKWSYMNTIKEADFLKHGSSKRIMDISTADQSCLWESLKTMDHQLFSGVYGKICGNPINFLNTPIRVHVHGQNTFRQLPLGNNESDSMVLRDALSMVIPELFPTTIDGSVEPSASKARVFIHGTIPDLDTPLRWLWSYMSYPDSFLHIAVFP